MVWSEGMVLKLASNEVREVHRALSAAYLQMLREVARVDSYVDRKAGLELCQRKWRLEALLRQLDNFDGPPPALELVPAVSRKTEQSEAA
jgi:hypothetical protein